jgi:glyceraldehyde 3-phosphate dehydrogenase
MLKLTEPSSASHLFKYNSVYGKFDGILIVDTDINCLLEIDHKIDIFSEKDPQFLPWRQFQIDVVLESTGRFKGGEGANKQLKAGAKEEVVTAPAKNHDTTMILG